MAAAEASDGSSTAEFVDADLRGARFIRVDLSNAVMRAVNLDGADLDAPWLLEGDASLLVNGVDVAPLVEAELNRRMPGRELRSAGDPESLRVAWAALERAWAAALDRVATMPAGAIDESVDGEWTFSQTLRHLVMATDTWLRRAILEIPQPFHPLGQPNAEYESDGNDMSVFATGVPGYAEVLTVRSERVTMVREFLADVTVDDLDQERRNPWAPDHRETVRSCLRVILEEEWEHLRFALRDLDAIDRSATAAEPVTE